MSNNVSILTNTTSMAANRSLNNAAKKVGYLNSVVSTGSSIVKASDNPSALTMASSAGARIDKFGQISSVMSQAMSVVQLGMSGMQANLDIMTRMASLATQVVNGAIGSKEAAMVQAEYTQLLAQVDSTVDGTKWGGIKLLSGGGGSVTQGSLNATAATGVAVANAFTNVISSHGLVKGTASAATVTTHPTTGNYSVSVTVGGIEYKNENVVGVVASGKLLLSAADNMSHIELNYDTAVTTITNAATFQSSLRSLLGYAGTPGTSGSVVFTPQSIAAATLAGVTISAGGGTDAGDYAIEYKGASAGGTGTFYLTDGKNTRLTATVTTAASQTETVTFTNGVSLALAAFNGTSDYGNHVFTVAAGTQVSMTFQIGEDSNQTLAVTFSPSTASSLAISSTNVGTAANAQSAQDKLKTASDTLSNNLAKLGAQMRRLELNKEAAGIQIENNKMAQSAFRDADVSNAMTELSQAEALQDFAMAMAVKANQLPSKLLALIRG